MKKEIAFKSNTITKENLPFPIVLYPGHYGAFFAFKKDDESKPHFCSCMYEAIENYIKIRKSSDISRNSDPTRMYILDSYDFPKSAVQDLMDKNIKEENVLKNLNFENKLCHECNMQIPKCRYCHEMYGGVFKQTYGWYVRKQSYEWGFDIYNMTTLNPELCPDDLLSLIEDREFKKIRIRLETINQNIRDLESNFHNLNESEKQNFHSLVKERIEIFKQLSKYYRKIGNVIENEVRRKFGHKKIGEAWISETILYYIVKKLFPEYEIKRHYRPKILEGLELDIYVEDINLGIEYQGIQHYKPIKHWGGEESLKKLKARDKKKRKLCDKNNINLLYFEYTDDLNEDFVKDKIKSILN